jgi:hypothetical protein
MMAGHFDPAASDLTAPAAIERRITTRHPCNLAASCRVMASLASGYPPIRVRNISVSGISLLVPIPIDAGLLLTIELKTVTRNLKRTLQVRVVYCTEHPSGDSIVGGTFTPGLSEEELRAFVG